MQRNSRRHRNLIHINLMPALWFNGVSMEAMTMSYSRDIMEELHALKREAGHTLKTSAEEWQTISREKAHSLAADVKTFLTDFRDALALDEAEIERAFAGRAAATMATALAAGVVIGYFLGRRR
jgi:hypothetical protein